MKYKIYTKEKGLIETDDESKYEDLTWHKEDGPALIGYYNKGPIESESYYINGKLHRGDGPAVIGYYINGKVAVNGYYINDKLHKTDGPALTHYDSNGKTKTSVFYYVEGKKHNLKGPAIIWFNNGIIKNTEYWINGKQLTFEEWKEHPLVKAETIEVDSKKELDALAKKDKEGIKTDDYFISSTGKHPVVYTLKKSKVFESFKEVYKKERI